MPKCFPPAMWEVGSIYMLIPVVLQCRLAAQTVCKPLPSKRISLRVGSRKVAQTKALRSFARLSAQS